MYVDLAVRNALHFCCAAFTHGSIVSYLLHPSYSRGGPPVFELPEPESQLEITENVQLKQEVQPTTETETAHQEDESISDVDPKHTYSLRSNRKARTFPDHLTFTIKIQNGITRFKQLADPWLKILLFVKSN